VFEIDPQRTRILNGELGYKWEGGKRTGSQ